MNKDQNEWNQIPEWMIEKENYIPETDKDTFVNKSILSLLRVIARIRIQNASNPKYQVNITLQLAATFLLLVLLSLSRSFPFVLIVIVYLLVVLSVMQADAIIRILKVSVSMTLLTFFIMLPALFLGNPYSAIMMTAKSFATLTAIGIFTHSASLGEITSAMKRFFIPDIFIMVLDITIKYVVLLGNFMLHMLYALKVRSVGKNKSKYMSMAGIAGTSFLKSKEMAEDMHHAMICRGFTGEYRVHYKSKLRFLDVIYIMLHLGIIFIFLYLGRNLP